MALFTVDVRMAGTLRAAVRTVLPKVLPSETLRVSCVIPDGDRTDELPRSPIP